MTGAAGKLAVTVCVIAVRIIDVTVSVGSVKVIVTGGSGR
jgi:hypothetical protein